MKATTRIGTGFLAIAVAASLVLGSCGASVAPEDTPQPPLDTTPTTTIAPMDGSVMDYLESHQEYSVLTDLVKKAGLAETLDTGEEFTLFAPSDTVFNAMSQATMDALTSDTERLRAFVLNHVWDVETMTIDLLDGSIEMMSGATLDVKVGDPITIDSFPITKPDIRVMNGVIHEIAGVITG